jgi:uncharacterized protein YrzB (UPF0473 family)
MKVLCSRRGAAARWALRGSQAARGGWEALSVVDEMDVITLQDEDGLEHRFNIIDIVEVERRRYAVLLPEDEEDAAAVIFRMESDDHLVPIEDDEELTRVMAVLEETSGYGEIVLEGDDDGAEDLGLIEETDEDYDDDDADDEED